MHTIKRAIIMAAGKGQRMQPITLETPKPLVKVNGTRMIDTVIHGLHANGIKEIYIVVGYLKEQFQCLCHEYEGVQLIENPFYDTCNNISSLYVVRDYLEDVMMLDGDQFVHNPHVLTPYFERSGYNAVWCEGESNEWMMQVKNGIVTGCSRNGGKQAWQLYSVSRWSREDGQKLKRHLEIEFVEKRKHQLYWDDLAMFCYPQEYELGIYSMDYNDIVEIDSLAELAALDPSYEYYMPTKKEKRENER
ncbi:MAG: phosphocholine cytidylyltransferase family protein [Erysipelotrichaceae bacterium]|nr:phosphocholine cytidylyltransferase family protein [Erysipelotrichaceae bacterium]